MRAPVPTRWAVTHCHIQAHVSGWNRIGETDFVKPALPAPAGATGVAVATAILEPGTRLAQGAGALAVTFGALARLRLCNHTTGAIMPGSWQDSRLLRGCAMEPPPDSWDTHAWDDVRPVDEAAIIARAQQNPAAFAPLYQAYVTPVYRYCYRRLGSREAAEDATSIIFERVLRPAHLSWSVISRLALLDRAQHDHRYLSPPGDARPRRQRVSRRGRWPERPRSGAGATRAPGGRAALAGDGAGVPAG